MPTKPINPNLSSIKKPQEARETERWQPLWSQIPSHIVTLSDYEQAARQYLPMAMQAILFENNLAPNNPSNNPYSNAAALDKKRWLPRMLNPKPIDLSCHLYNPHSAVPLDIRLAHPLWLSPVAHQGLYHPLAEKATLEAANLLHTPCIFSAQSNTLFSELLPKTTVTNAVQWYWQSPLQKPTQSSHPSNTRQARRDYNLQLIETLAAQGMQLLVITVDAPHSGVRAVSRRAQATLPSYCQAVNLAQMNTANSAAQSVNDLLVQAPDWADIEWLVKRCPVPVLLKGILHPNDAKKAQDVGCAGIVASNHGQRVLADVIAVADMLPELRQSVGADMVIIADGGVRSGSDMAKLITLGADGVGIGRGYIYGLALAGALGVAHINKLLLEELQVTMATLGAADVQGLREAILR